MLHRQRRRAAGRPMPGTPAHRRQRRLLLARIGGARPATR